MTSTRVAPSAERLAVHPRDRHAPAAWRFYRDVPNAAVLDAHEYRAVRQYGEMDTIARFEIRNGAHVLGDGRLALDADYRELRIPLIVTGDSV